MEPTIAFLFFVVFIRFFAMSDSSWGGGMQRTGALMDIDSLAASKPELVRYCSFVDFDQVSLYLFRVPANFLESCTELKFDLS